MLFREPMRAFALTHRDPAVLADSASGGAFTALAEPILRNGGVVYAARLADDGVVRHVGIASLSQLQACRGSVYAQSDASCVFHDCKESLREGKRVLFVGTPCQVAALRCYLDAERTGGIDSLILCDLICHGVPSQELLQSYFAWLSRKDRADDGIHGYKFRSKKRGWGLYYYYYYFRGGKRHEVLDSAANDPYFSAFNAGLTFRESCYSCPFARLERVSDLTIGDFWDVGEVNPAAADPRGVSLVLANTSKGESYLLDECAPCCRLEEADPHEAARYNHNLNAPSERPAERKAFMHAMAEKRAEGRLQDVFSEELRVKLTPKRAMKAMLPERLLALVRKARG